MKTAAVFSGQGSQFVGMCKEYFDFAVARVVLEEACDTLKLDLKKLIFDGPESDLTLTQNTQPALLTVSTAMFRFTHSETGFLPDYVAGHSLGEYSALVSAKTLDFSKALLAVRERGLSMQSACPVGQGGMAAVMGLEDHEVEKLCEWTETQSGQSPLKPANFNSPGQIVISGNQKAIEWLKNNYNAESSGINKRLKLIPLNVSAPFHSPLMKPAQEKMEKVLSDMRFEVPLCPIIQNTTAMETTNIEYIRRELIAQVSAPVKWTQTIKRLEKLEVKRCIEFGPGKVLTGLIKKISPEISTLNLATPNEIKTI